MRNNYIKIGLIFVICLVSAGLFACKSESGFSYDYVVTFNYNISEDIEANCPDQYLGVNEGSIIIQPEKDSSVFPLRTVPGYHNKGWYLPAVDENGKVITEEDGTVKLGEQWDFKDGRISESITLYAKFMENPVLTVMLPEGNTVVYSDEPGNSRSRPEKSPEITGSTFIDYYTDPDYKTVMEWPYVFTEANETVYARYISGIWSVIRTPEQLISILLNNPAANIYLMNDLNFTGKNWLQIRNYRGVFEGNNYTVSNIDFSIIQSKDEVSNFAIFGTLQSGAVIKNVEFKDCSFSFTAQFGFSADAALLVWKLEAGATLSSVTLSGTLTDKTKAQINVTLSALCAIEVPGSTIEDCDYSDVIIIQ